MTSSFKLEIPMAYEISVIVSAVNWSSTSTFSSSSSTVQIWWAFHSKPFDVFVCHSCHYRPPFAIWVASPITQRLCLPCGYSVMYVTWCTSTNKKMGSITKGTVHQLTQKITAYAFKGRTLRHTMTKIMEIAYPRELTFRNLFPPHELRETCRPSCTHHAKNPISCRMSPNFAHVFYTFFQRSRKLETPHSLLFTATRVRDFQRET